MSDPHDPEAALRHRIVRLDGEITDATAQVTIAQLLFLQHQDDRLPVTLRIESPGGSVVAGMAIVDTVRDLRPPVRTRAPRQAHGMAAVILACGHKGERVVGRIAELSIAPIENVSGTPEDVRPLRHKLAAEVAVLCGQVSEVVAEHLLVGRSLTPDEAVAYGLADQVEE